MLEFTCCPLCGEDKSDPLFDAVDTNYGNPGKWRIVRCTHCGLGYQNPRIPADQIGAFYPKNYYTHDSGQAVRIGWASKAFETYDGVRMIEPPFQGARLLDVGSGSGDLVAKYARLGWQAEGYDVDRDAASAAAARGVKVTVAALLKDAGFPSGSFDSVTMWDSLEHVHEPRQHLEEAMRVLKPSGRLWIGIPDLDSWPSRLFREHWHHVAAPIHVTYWSRASIQYAAKTIGLRITSEVIPRKTACTRPSLGNLHIHPLAKKTLGLPLRVVDRMAKGGHLVTALQR